MNEIKFRAWDWEKKKMWLHKIWIYYLCWKIQVAIDYILWSDFLEVMQYTWLKDKNWKEIYEWDIIEYEYHNWWYVEVKYQNGYFYPLVNIKEWYNCFDKYIESEFEIIWNIYENKNLIINN